jgi:hypothetical protein
MFAVYRDSGALADLQAEGMREGAGFDQIKPIKTRGVDKPAPCFFDDLPPAEWQKRVAQWWPRRRRD